jgi:superfamily II DNA or RNA helicase
MDRNESQQNIINNWIQNKAMGFVEAFTGYGKTRLAILAIQECNRRDANRTTNVIVPTTTLKNTWTKPKKGFIDAFKLKNVEVFVINTYIKFERSCDLLICDEVHRMTNDNALHFTKVINETKYSWFLGLSATLEANHIAFLNRKNIISVGKVTAQECKENGWVTDFITINFGVELDEIDRNKYDTLHKSFNKYFATFGHDFDKAMSCLTNKNVREAHAREFNIPVERVMISALEWNRNMRERKTFLYHAHSKMTIAKELTKLDKHMICFSESVDFTQKLCDEIGEKAVSYHSKNGVKANREALRKFMDKRTKVNCICTAKSMDEGFDAPDADMAIICSRTSKRIQNGQRSGRICRAKEGKKAYVINLYIKNSQDEIWLRKASKGTQCLWMDDLEQLKQLINDSR